MTRANRVLIYDDYCPLCTWYTAMFVKYGLLNENQRLPFSRADISIITEIDLEKGKDEIPFIDVDSKHAWYGIDALLEILGQRFPFVKSLGKKKLINWFLLRFYRFISYNRKVIVAKKCGNGKFDCSPAFNVFYRIIFMLLFFSFNTFMLIPIHANLLDRFYPYHHTLTELQMAHLVLVATNIGVAFSLKEQKNLEYLGQVNMLAVLTVLLTIPLMLFNILFDSYDPVTAIYLLLLTIFVIKEYFRRMSYAGVAGRHKPVVIINLTCFLGFIIYVFT